MRFEMCFLIPARALVSSHRTSLLALRRCAASLRRPAPRAIPKIATPVNPVWPRWDPHVPKPPNVKDLRTALQAIRAAADVMAEGRQYLELRGDLTGEFAAAKVQGPPQRIQVLTLPKLASGQSPERFRISGVKAEHKPQPHQESR